jgi:hypothetical protein
MSEQLVPKRFYELYVMLDRETDQLVIVARHQSQELIDITDQLRRQFSEEKKR